MHVHVSVDGGAPFEVEARLEGDLVHLLIGGKMWRAVVEPAAQARGELLVFIGGEAIPVEVDRAGARGALSSARAGGGKLKVISPMPGRIVAVRVKAGDHVGRGDLLLTLEAMKMQNEFTSPASGRVSVVRAAAGQLAAPGEVLVEIEPDAPSP